VPAFVPTSADRWLTVAESLAATFATARRDIERARAETPEHLHIATEAFTLRNLTILGIEALDLMNAYWKADIAESAGRSADVPRTDTGRYREVLEVTHPARPYNPILATSPLEEQLRQVRDQIAEHGSRISSASPNDTDPRRARFGRIALRIDQNNARRVSPHETLGLLRALADLVTTASEQEGATPGEKALARQLNEQFTKLEVSFVRCLARHLNITTGGARENQAREIAHDYQNIGLLRARRRDRNGAENDRKTEEEFLQATSNEWELYHTGIKQIAWFETLLQVPRADIETLDKLATDSREILRQRGPLDGVFPFEAVVTAGTAPLLRQFKIAREQAPFFQRHQETFRTAGKVATSIALTYSLGVAGSAIAVLGESTIYLRHLAPTIQRLRDLAVLNPPKILNPQSLSEPLSDALKSQAKTRVEKLIHPKVDDWVKRHLFPAWSNNDSATRQKCKTAQIDTGSQNSLLDVYGAAANTLSNSAWRSISRQHHDFIVENRETLLTALKYTNEIEQAMASVRGARRAAQELDESTQVNGATYPRAYRDRQHKLIGTLREIVTQAATRASSEKAVNTASGFQPETAHSAALFFNQREQIRYRLLEATFSDATHMRSSTLGRRSPAHVLVRYDPSSLNPLLFDLLNLEDKDARNCLRDPIPGFRVGRRYHVGLGPTYHVRKSVLSLLFPAIKDRTIAEQIIGLARAPNLEREVLADMTPAQSPHVPTQPSKMTTVDVT